MSYWKLSVLPLILVIVGCTSNPTLSNVVPTILPLEKPEIPWPAPVKACSLDLRMDNIGGKAFILIPYKNYMDYSACTLDKERYVRDLIDSVCYYKGESDSRCKN